MVIDYSKHSWNFPYFQQKSTTSSFGFEPLFVGKNNRITIGDKLDHITFKYKYIGSDCTKNSNISSWSQVGVMSIEYSALVEKKAKNKGDYDLKAIGNAISNLYKGIEAGNFANFYDATCDRGYQLQFAHSGLSCSAFNYTHLKPSSDKEGDGIAKMKKLKRVTSYRNDYVSPSDTIEMQLIICDDKNISSNKKYVKAECRVRKAIEGGCDTNPNSNSNDSNDNGEKDKKQTYNLGLVKDRIYFPGIALKGCNCVENGGVTYEVSWEMQD